MMNSKNYIIKYNLKTFNMQIITMNNSYYIYIGDSQMKFENLILSIPNTLNKEKSINNINDNKALLPDNISSTLLIDDEVNDSIEILNTFFVSKLKVPIYLSFNIDNPLVFKDPLFISFLQENILNILIQKK